MQRTLHAVLTSTVLLLIAAPSDADAQFRGGGHAIHAGQLFGGSGGVGLRGGIQLPLIPIDLMAAGEYFFPDCGELAGCGLQGVTLDANFRMIFPVVRPYISGGLAHRRYSPGGDALTINSSGLSVGAGIDVRLGGLGGFAEARYEFTEAPRSQSVVRIGILLGLF